ncbi:unnamed protein product, partial [Prorocentrum cordatum]
MAPRWAALVLPAALLGGLPRGAGAGALRRQQPAGPRRASSASLLDKGQRKWNWESASEETKTEWGIVLKRYVMFDMNLLELEHRWDLAMPSAAAGAGPGAAGAADEQLEKVQAKVAKLHDNLEKAVLDQNTSDSTAEDMQRDIRTNHLTKEQKRTLREEHQRERFGFFAVEASAQDVLSQATALVQAIAARRARPSQSWASIVPAPATYPALLPGNASAGWPPPPASGARR